MSESKARLQKENNELRANLAKYIIAGEDPFWVAELEKENAELRSENEQLQNKIKSLTVGQDKP